MISDTEILIRLLISCAIGLAVGYERERRDQAAGLRTHMVLILGATLAMVVSINLSLEYHANADPARLAAQVVSGVGFLGAGAILRYGISIRGLTTAASLWTTAMIGLAIGAGYYVLGGAATLLALFILSTLNIVEKRFLPTYNSVHIQVEAGDRPGVVAEIKARLHHRERRAITFGYERDLVGQQVKVEAEIHLWDTDSTDGLMEELTAIQGVRRVAIHG